MTPILFGPPVYFDHGARNHLPDLVTRAQIRKPLFVTDRGVISAGVFSTATEGLDQTVDKVIFSEVPPNPTESAAKAGAALFTENRCDGVIAVGGGAAIDLAKAIVILASHRPPLWNYSNRNPNELSLGNTPPLIVMPTTAGTGSEVGRSAVIVFDNGIKAGVRCPKIVTYAICDPELTLGLPPLITATTGMDALAHCIETYCSPIINPPADAIALDGMQRIFCHIRTAVQTGTDRAARWAMMMGSLEGALCFQKGMGAVHACSHPIGALGYHHGTLNAIFLPHVLRLNLQAIGPKADQIARLAGAPDPLQLAKTMAELVAELGIPTRLRDLGLKASQLENIGQAAMQDNANKTNPVTMTAERYQDLIEQAL